MLYATPVLASRIRSRLACAAPGISAEPNEENLRYFKVMIMGPSSSPYEGAQARLQGFHRQPCRTKIRLYSMTNPSGGLLPNMHMLPLMVKRNNWLHHGRKMTFLSGGVFRLELFLPEDYPMASPKVHRSSASSFYVVLLHTTRTVTKGDR